MHLENKHRQGQHDHNEHNDRVVGIVIDRSIIIGKGVESVWATPNDQQWVSKVDEEECQKILVVSRAKAIVDEIAVMVVVCTATIANGAVEGAVRLY